MTREEELKRQARDSLAKEIFVMLIAVREEQPVEELARKAFSAADTFWQVAHDNPSNKAKHYPPGMGEESRRLHREYNVLMRAQMMGAKNGGDVVRLTDEAATKGIVLIPGGENL